MKIATTTIMLILCLKLAGQEKVSIFFNQNWEITSYKKGIYYRVTSIDGTGLYYDGDFTDYSLKNKSIIATGRYLLNKKDGEFVEYFENGTIKFKGRFKNNNPDGRWFYYYPNEQLKMIVEFPQNDFQILEYRDSSNNSTLMNGTGKWATHIEVFGNPTKVITTFREGKREGIWEYIDERGKVILKEKYINSKLTNSEYKGTWNKEYYSKPYINNSYFIEPKYLIIENKICERDLNEKLIPFKKVKKILTLSNSTNLSYLNSQLPVDQILYAIKDNFNNYWFGTANNGLVKYDSIFTFFNKSNTNIKGNYISTITADKNNKIWFSFGSDKYDYDILTSGLACLNNNEITIYNTRNSGLTCNSINDIDIDDRNVKWFATLNCILSYDEVTQKWNKHYDKTRPIKQIDTIKYKDKSDYISHANKIKSITSSYESESGKSKSYKETFTPPNIIYSTISYYEPPSNYTSIEVLPNNKKLFNSANSGFGSFDSLNWEIDTSKNNLEYITFVLSKKEQLNDSTIQMFIKQISTISNNLFIEQIILGTDNSFWLLTNDNILKVKNDKVIAFDLLDQLIKYPADGRIKQKFYYLFSDIDGGIWATINSAVLRIE